MTKDKPICSKCKCELSYIVDDDYIELYCKYCDEVKEVIRVDTNIKVASGFYDRLEVLGVLDEFLDKMEEEYEDLKREKEELEQEKQDLLEENEDLKAEIKNLKQALAEMDERLEEN